jgi:hypothetical protein
VFSPECRNLGLSLRAIHARRVSSPGDAISPETNRLRDVIGGESCGVTLIPAEQFRRSGEETAMISTTRTQNLRYSAGYPDQIVPWSAIRSRRWARIMSRPLAPIYLRAATPTVARALATPKSRALCAEMRWKRFIAAQVIPR